MSYKLTDNEIKKALDWCEQFTDNLVTANIDTKKRTLGLQAMQTCKSALDLINRLQAENERLKETTKNMSAYVKGNKWGLISFVEFCKNLKAEAYKEFADKVCDEITDAIINNGKVIKERIEKHNVNRLEDSFCCMCDGKIRALGGIEYFIKNLLKELVGDK